VNEILASIKISQVYRALAGREPRRTGPDTWRAPATWRGGDGFNVSMDDARGLWHDFTTDEGGGLLDLIVRARGGSRQDALRWCADLAGVQIEDKPLSPEDRARWAAERRQLERDLPAARYWQRAAVSIAEELLTTLKVALFDPTLPQPEIGEIADVEALLSTLPRLDGPALVSEYKWWRERYPGVTSALVVVAHRREQCERAALEEYLGITRTEAA